MNHDIYIGDTAPQRTSYANPYKQLTHLLRYKIISESDFSDWLRRTGLTNLFLGQNGFMTTTTPRQITPQDLLVLKETKSLIERRPFLIKVKFKSDHTLLDWFIESFEKALRVCKVPTLLIE